jgi:hypothetical protein
MRIAQLAPLAESVPPKLYGGTERVVAGGDAQGHSGGARDADGVLGALFGGEATEERQIGPLIERRAKVVRWQSVRDRGGPIRFRQWQALMVRNRHEAGAGKLPHYIGKARQVEPAMHGGHEGHA